MISFEYVTDKGNDVESAQWYPHLTRADKEAAGKGGNSP